MKKNFVRLGIFAMTLFCALSFAACGGNNSSSASSKQQTASSDGAVSSQADPVSSASSAVESSQPAASSDGQKDLAEMETVEDFIKSGMMDSEIKALQDTAAEEGMKIELTAEGNKMILIFECGELLGDEVDTETAGTIFQALAESMTEDMEEMATGLKDAIEQEDVSVELRFEASGEELYSQEFFAK